MNYPILMADIIDSGRKDSKVLIHQFKKIVASINTSRKLNFLSPLTITLGDEFQGIVDTIPNGLKIILEIEELIIEHLYDLKFRYVLSFGAIDTEINSNIAYEMLGKGLTKARKSLNELKKNQNSRFHVQLDSKNNEYEEIINKAFVVYQSFIDSWKVKDYKIIWQFLNRRHYKVVAKNVNLDESSAWRRERSLRMHEYFTTKDIVLFLIAKLK